MIYTNYNNIMEKLALLKFYNSNFKLDELPSDEILLPYHRIRKEVFSILKSDFKDFFELLVSSGIMDVFYGDVEQDSFVVIDIKGIHFLDNNFIQLVAGGINSGGTELPQDMENWFLDKFTITPIQYDEDGSPII